MLGITVHRRCWPVLPGCGAGINNGVAEDRPVGEACGAVDETAGESQAADGFYTGLYTPM